MSNSSKGFNKLFAGLENCKAKREICERSIMEFLGAGGIAITEENHVEVIDKSCPSSGLTAEVGHDACHNDSVHSKRLQSLLQWCPME